AILARRHGRPVPPDPSPVEASGPQPDGSQQAALFEDLPGPDETVEMVVEAYRDQFARVAAIGEAGRFRLLAAVESAGALAAAEMGHHGLPWDAKAHDAVLRELLGEPT